MIKALSQFYCVYCPGELPKNSRIINRGGLDYLLKAIALIQHGLFAKGRIVSGNAVPAIRIQTG